MECTIYMDRETEAQAWRELARMNQAARNWTMEQYIEWLIEDTMKQRKAAEEKDRQEATHQLENGEGVCFSCSRWQTQGTA